MKMQLFEIKDRFNITGRGIVYMINNPEQILIKVNDIFFDQSGNRFKVKAIELIRVIREDINDEDNPVFISFDNLDGVDVIGEVLEMHM